MKRALSLGVLVLALGSCETDQAPTQSTSDSSNLVGVLARLESKTALPAAERLQARLTVGTDVGSWIDSAYAKGRVLRLGQVPRGSSVTLDVRAYTALGKDTTWKWFARKADTSKGDLNWIVLDAQVDTLPAAKTLLVQVGQPLAVPPGTWYTIDSTTPWASLIPDVVGSSGTITPVPGTTLRVRLRMVVPGTRDTLASDTARIVIPAAVVQVDPPRFVPGSGPLPVGATISLEPATTGDVIRYRIAGSTFWTTYSTPIPAGNFTLEAQSVRGSQASKVDSATYTLVVVVDSFVAAPRFSPASGSVLASSDSIRFDSLPVGDTVEYRRNEGTTWQTASAIAATTDTIHARSRRGGLLSSEVEGIFSIRAGQPGMPTISLLDECASDGCDPGLRVRIAHDSGLLEYATDTTTRAANWKTFTSGEVLTLTTTTTLFARTTRSGVPSATAGRTVIVVQPAPVAIDSLDRTPDTVRVRLSTTSGILHYQLTSQSTPSQVTSPAIVLVPVGDSLRAWSVRGSQTSAGSGFRAIAQKPGKPAIVPTTASGPLAPNELVRLLPATPGDSLQYRLAGSSVWIGYTGSLRSGTAGTFQITARALRNGLASDDSTRSFSVDTTKLAEPTLVPLCDPSCDPGTRITIRVGFGTELLHGSIVDTSRWTGSGDSALIFTATRDTIVHARSRSGSKSSAVVTFNILIRQPGVVSASEVQLYPDSVRVRIVASPGDTILYARNPAFSFVNSGKTDTLDLTVPVFDSLRIRSKRGTALGPVNLYVATPSLKPEKPRIVTTTVTGPLAPDEVVRLEPATPGDSLQYRLAGSTVWIGYTQALSSGSDGTFKITARALRNGLVSDTTSASFLVDTAKLAQPTLVPTCNPTCDPGVQLTIKAGFGLLLRHGPIADSSRWTETADSLLTFTVSQDTTVHARSTSSTKSSPVVTFSIVVRQPAAVTVSEIARFPDSVRLRIVGSRGDTILYAQSPGFAYTNSGKADTLLLTVRVLDSLRFRTKRGTALGPEKPYKVLPGAPVAPTISPAAGHIRDTTKISLKGTAGDTLAYRIGTSATWIPFTTPIQLSAGRMVVHMRSMRHGRSTTDSTTFVVHDRPDTVTFAGCTSNCSPGSSLAISPPSGSTAYWTNDSIGGTWTAYTGSPFVLDASMSIWAYADSAGYRSKTTGVQVEVVQPGSPKLQSVRTKRPNLSSSTDTAFVTITSAQDGDSLRIRVGSGAVKSSLVAGSASVVQPLLVNQTVTAWTSRGATKSDSVSYTFKALPPPVEQTAPGVFNRGKSFAFSLASAGSGSEGGDVILLATAPGSWVRRTSVTLSAIGIDTVYARTVRKLLDGSFGDSSAIRKVAYTIDTTMITDLSTNPGTFTSTFRPDVLTYIDSVDATTTSLEVSYTARTPADIQFITFNGSVDPVVSLTNAAKQSIEVEVKNIYGTSTTYLIDVRKRPSDSGLSSLSTTLGKLYPDFATSTTSYIDSVEFDATSVVVTAVARTPADVANITYNGGTSKTIPLNLTGVTSILVDITNTAGKHLVYTILAYKKSYPYGSVTHGGKTYKTATIGTQTWMAENLQYGGVNNDTGACPGVAGTDVPGDASACAQYGRIYSWFEVVGGNTVGSTLEPSGIQGVCPTGWHVPSNAEWTTLKNFVEADPRVGVEKAGIALKSRTIWSYSAGSDLFGFGAIPSWTRAAIGTFNSPNIPSFWSATRPSYSATSWNLYENMIKDDDFYPDAGRTVRCVKN